MSTEEEVTGPIRVTRQHAQELRRLKEAWGLRSVDAVLERLIAPHRLEQLRSLIRVEEDTR